MTHDHRPGSAPCREIFARLSDYIDGELTAELCDDVDRHLDDCVPCQAFLRSLRRTIAWIESDDAPPIPDEILSSLREAYRAYREGRG